MPHIVVRLNPLAATLVALVCGFAPAAVLAQTKGAVPITVARTARAVPTDVPPVIDGRVDEDVWDSAPVVADFLQRCRTPF